MRSTADEARARVLVAARREFAENGFAGARIDRISEEANVSKERLYVYFGNKHGLWAALMSQEITRLSSIGAVDSLDGAAIVGRLYDAFVGDSELLRLFHWQLLEVTEDWPEDNRAHLNREKIAILTTALGEGRARSSIQPELVVRLMITVAASCASEYLGGTRRSQRREAIRQSSLHLGALLLAPA